jgi:hypothetical protein
MIKTGLKYRLFDLISLAEAEVSVCEQRNPHTDPTRYQTQSPLNEGSVSFPEISMSPV